ncbi:class I SAM-dependent methyltransferase [Halobacillus salinarum]|uniref:Class I SAM-dependent methyltransferase n=1 Tax=Halobacillus salinarum TaxID=2932257 RepID=A0ABY4EQH1_9BACI|nr:class I SAM-dependent methyltransferase [Halobacillus salinarum]UOQ46321.1 class I SAM-dependent methyltransferase [Halobacillus salinarum]
MSYGRMAQVYDQLMEDAPYDQWIYWTKEVLGHYYPGASSILELGCGTGEITYRLHNQRYEVTGVDLSEEMLALAAAKKPSSSIQWIHQDIRNLEGFSNLDCIVSYCDVLNYITTEEDLLQVMERTYTSLKTGGLFLFDVHSLSHMMENLNGRTFAEVHEDLSYIWFCDCGKEENTVLHDLTFFVQNEACTYDRFEEQHFQKGYSINKLRTLLEQAGFKLLQIHSDFIFSPAEAGDRLFFICQK